MASIPIIHQAKTVVLKLECASDPPEGLLKHNLLSPTLRVSDSVGVEWGLIVCILNNFPPSADPIAGDHILRFTGIIQWIFILFVFSVASDNAKNSSCLNFNSLFNSTPVI